MNIQYDNPSSGTFQSYEKRQNVKYQLKCQVTFLCGWFFLSFSVDLVSDPAIRHENGKQVARWNVDIASFAGNSSDDGASPSAYGVPHAPHHPAAVGAGARYTTGHHPHNGRHPNGELAFDEALTDFLLCLSKNTLPMTSFPSP